MLHSRRHCLFGCHALFSGLALFALITPRSNAFASDDSIPGSALADGVWQQLAPPTWLIWHTAIYDPVRDRMIVFDGMDGLLTQNELWELSLSGDVAWKKLHPSGVAPPRLRNHGAIYDPVRERMLVFGGSTPTEYHNELWALSLTGEPQWSEVGTAGTPPSPRIGHGMVYDPIADRIVIFGGITETGTVAEVWSLSLGGTPTWSRIVPSGTAPSARHGASFVFDASRNRVVMFGGRVGAAPDALVLNDTWELSLEGSPAWHELSPSGPVPAPRYGHTAVYDPIGDRMVMLNGAFVTGTTFHGIQEAWALSAGASPEWSRITVPGPAHPGGSGGAAVYDSARHRVLLFGGWMGNTSSVRNDVWALALDGGGGWSKAWTSQAPPATGRIGHSAILDPVRRRMIVFGGAVLWVGEANPLVNDVWSLRLDSPYTWTRLQPTGVPPPARSAHSAIYDPIRDRMIVFAGWSYNAEFADLWELTLSEPPHWRLMLTNGEPPSGRHDHTAIYDPERDRMIVYGGQVGTVYSSEVWELTLSGMPTWNRITAAGPGARAGHTAIYDPAGDRMIVFGGSNGSALADLWQLSLSGQPAWSPIVAGGSRPAGRRDHSAVLDATRGRMLVLGGDAGMRAFRGDLLALSLSGAPAWTVLDPLDPPFAMGDHSAVYDPAHDGMWVYAGQGGGDNETWAYWPSGGPTPVLIQSFTLARSDDGVEIRWVVAEGSGSEEFELVASHDDESWIVPSDPPQGNVFVARDRSPRLAAGGAVTYTLSYRDPERGWLVLAAETLRLEAAALRTQLLALHPNPARDGVVIPYVLRRGERAIVTVHDVAGREVARVHDGRLEAGAGRFVWPRTDTLGRRLPAGVYLVRLATPDAVDARKLILAP